MQIDKAVVVSTGVLFVVEHVAREKYELRSLAKHHFRQRLRRHGQDLGELALAHL